MKYFIIHILFLALLPFTLQSQQVVSIRVNGMISPATADYIHKGIKKAVALHGECVIIHLNTPGGLLQSTRTTLASCGSATAETTGCSLVLPSFRPRWPSEVHVASRT